MPRIYRFLVLGIRNGFYWALDYAYVLRVQAAALVHPNPPASYVQGRHGLPPLVIIPGVYESWYLMKPLLDFLVAAGYPLHIVSGLGYNRGSVEEMAAIVADYIKQHTLTDCIIIAHSKGGLIGKYLLARNSENGSIRGLVAVNTPFSGSLYAYLVPLPSIRIFTPHSKILTSLNANLLVNNKVASIYGRFDPHIPYGSHLDGARNIQLSTYGHFRIMAEKRIHQAVLEEIKKFS